ncbi:MAG: HD domain-containing phosphohydrolase [Syntrophobacterales bacterium]|jgi:response regulator RpfG family c-di-GMP phosphodiesterase
MASPKLPEKILMVDDERPVLDSFRRQLRGKVNLYTALGAEEALNAIDGKGPFAVVVSDFKMPGMNGIELLARIKAKAPDTVRMMLTGYADLGSTINAINQGNIFRFLTKPCDSESMLRTLVDGIRQYRLIRAERDLLDQTLRGSVKVLTDLLALLKPSALGRANRISHYVNDLAHHFGVDQNWELETAALLSQIGCITLPDDIIRKVSRGLSLDLQERRIFLQHPQTGAEMVSNIPRMEEVAKIIAYQEKNFDGSGAPQDQVREDEIPLGARIIKVLLDFDALIAAGDSKGTALEKLKKQTGFYDPALITALDMVLGLEAKYDVKELNVIELEAGMILADDVIQYSSNKRLLAKGQQLSDTLVKSIRSYHRILAVKEPIRVMVSLRK